ncbi:chromosome transmission fidelity protein 8 homolog [Amphiura filiformis]|uniref:chromosome transmission fidelity protein 8 homolog n=1 Tax=Amphiura filiformis TaxID=82378 RepID=UPI003B225A2F
MVQIMMKLAMPGHCPEWMLIELQGKLESKEEEEMAGNFIGDLHFNKKGVPILIIGHHILYGKVTDLEKPFLLILKKNQPTHSANLDISMETSDIDSKTVAMETDQNGDEIVEKNDSGVDHGVHYEVGAVIKKKLMFKTRPKPIITNVPKKL